MTGGLPFKILIVEDDADDRYFMDEAFVEIGYQTEVKKFINGEYLLRYLDRIERDTYPKLIILDNSLPKLNAADLLAILKKDARFAAIPMVVYSTTMSPAYQQELINAGAYACFQKPAVRSEILQMVRQFRDIAEQHAPVNE